MSIFNARSLTDELNKIRETLAKTSNDWKVRIDALQMMRSLLIAGADQFDEMTQALRTLEVPFQSSVKDLRSQVNTRLMNARMHSDFCEYGGGGTLKFSLNLYLYTFLL